MPHAARNPAAWLDIVSYARKGPRAERRFTAAEIETIGRTVARTPEVMVKVSGGAGSVSRALAHFRYIDRHGDLEVETDQGERLEGKGVERELLANWDLEAASAHGSGPYQARPGRKPIKLTHHIVLSMPGATNPEKLLAASRVFAREQFAFQHRYALVLHTDQAHPHVHLVVKAEGDDGQRLNIRKATLRTWRQEFARQLRAQGVAANATDRAARGQTRKSLRDGIYRAAQRGESTHMRRAPAHPSVRARLWNRRDELAAGWRAVAETLREQGHALLASRAARFGQELPPARTDQEFWTTRPNLRQRDPRDRVAEFTR